MLVAWWSQGVLEQRSVGVKECWLLGGVKECWSEGVLVAWWSEGVGCFWWSEVFAALWSVGCLVE